MKQQHFILIFSFLILFSSIITCFDQSVFQKCGQRGFCNRLRHNLQKDHQFYSVDTQSLKLRSDRNNNYFFTGKLTSQGGDPWYTDLIFRIDALKHGIFRFRIKEFENEDYLFEKQEPFRRNCEDILVAGAETTIKPKIEIDEKNKLTIIKNEKKNTKMVIQNDKFIVRLFIADKEAMVFNGNNQLVVESVFFKQQPPQPKLEGNNTKTYDGETALSFDLSFTNSQHLYGLPERAYSLNLQPTTGPNAKTNEPLRLYNLDVFRYEIQNPIGLYGTVPIVWSVNQQDNLTTAIFHHNPSEQFVDIEKFDKSTSTSTCASQHASTGCSRTRWITETGVLDLFLLPGPNPTNIFDQYTRLTGRPYMPQYFSLGHHMSRWNYKDTEDVIGVDNNFDGHNIPYDVIWLDIEHTEDKQYFTWDSVHFKDPLALQEIFRGKGRRIVTITDPHIKRKQGYVVHEASTKGSFYIKNGDGKTDFEGECWPGKSSWLDYYNPAVREYWASLYSTYPNLLKFDQNNKCKGPPLVLYTWIDMNEPSCFSGSEITLGKDTQHFNGVHHSEIHNMYGYYMGMSTYQGHINRANANDRPFILTRSFFSGSQRYTAVWTGDNTASWSHLGISNALLSSLSLGNIVYTGSDIGGFFDNPSSELLLRWYQLGLFYPFSRAHAHIDTKRREPWLYLKDDPLKFYQLRKSIIRRYQMLPYYYTLAFKAHVSGTPIWLPLFVEYPMDGEALEIEDEVLIGKDLMIKGVATEGAKEMEVYIPKDDIWYDYNTGKRILTPTPGIFTKPTNRVTMDVRDDIVVLQRGGSMIPLHNRIRKSSWGMLGDPYTLQFAVSKDGCASGQLYIDDGMSFDYQKKGSYTLRQFTVSRGHITNREGKTKGLPRARDQTYHPTNTLEKIIIYGHHTTPHNVTQQTQQHVVTAGYGGENIKTLYNISFEYDDKLQKLTLHNVQLPVDQDWDINID